MGEFGSELRRLMAVRGMGVRELARMVPCNPGYVSNLRHGRNEPSPATARRLDETLNAGGLLAALAREQPARRREPAGELAPATRPSDQAMRLRLSGFSAGQVHELISHLSDQWHALVKTDNLLGPRHALAGVTANLGVIDAMLTAVGPPARQVVLRLGARYAESSAWLHEDSADMAGATYWTRRAMEWALEGDDRLMVAWSLFRRSQQATASGDAAHVAGLAAAARREGGELPGPMLAAILQQEAHGRALAGAERACNKTLDQAQALAAAPDDPGDASCGHGSFCTPAYLEMQRGVCWLRLGHPARAIAALDTAIGSLPPAYRRDRGVALSRQSGAFAAAGEPARAAEAALQALGIARDPGPAACWA